MSIMGQANAVLNALEEGALYFVIAKGESKGLSKDKLRVYVWRELEEYGWSAETLSYWIDDWMRGFK
jgi:hypothetical protein